MKRIVKKNKDKYIRLKKEELINMLYIDISAIIKKLKDDYNIWISNIKKGEQIYGEELYAQKQEQQPMASKRHISNGMYMYQARDEIHTKIVYYKTLSYIQNALRDNILNLDDLKDIEAIRIPNKAFVALR